MNEVSIVDQTCYFDKNNHTNKYNLIKSDKINKLCSIFFKHKIYSKTDLIKKLDKILTEVVEDKKIFKEKYNKDYCFEIFKKALECYQKYTDPYHQITITEENKPFFYDQLKHVTARSSLKRREPSDPELQRLTKSYDQLQKANKKIDDISQQLEMLISTQEYAVCPQIVLGIGDAGTTVWLEKYQHHHGTLQEKLKKGEMPSILLIGKTTGNWKHDYTLGQPHNLLERGDTKSNPRDFTTKKNYKNNSYANARHLFQSNLINIAKTQAPIIKGYEITKIEKKENHLNDWKVDENDYRLWMKTPSGKEQIIYTQKIDICSGLGAARNIFPGQYIDSSLFETLRQFNEERKLTPIVDGNQFMLTDSEEKSPEKRCIVVYGGGANATACYRKAFYGHDLLSEGAAFYDLYRFLGAA